MPSLEFVFHDGARAPCQGALRSLELKHVGEVLLVSGRVLACDPFAPDELIAFEQVVPTGKHPVVLTLADMGSERLVAYSTIQFARDRRVARWTMATRPGERVVDLDEGDIFAYPVDSGTGCFIDAEVAGALQDDEFMKAVFDAFQRAGEPSWAALEAPARSTDGGANALLFSTGLGDGVYSSYFGFSESDDVVALTTVFDIVDTDDAPLSHPEKRPWWRFWS